jgi:hypothetical protein
MTTSPLAAVEELVERSENDELRASMLVLGAVVEELAERVELLESRESLRAAEKQ